jgi:hypothetical protein
MLAEPDHSANMGLALEVLLQHLALEVWGYTTEYVVCTALLHCTCHASTSLCCVGLSSRDPDVIFFDSILVYSIGAKQACY